MLILLLTSNEEAVPLTLRSRCQRLELRPLPLEAVAKLLIDEQGLSQERAQLLGRLSGGRLGWALAAASDSTVIEERTRQLQRLQEVVDGGLEVRFEYSRELAAQYGRARETVRDVLGLWVAPDLVSERKSVELGHQDVGQNKSRLFDGDNAQRLIPIACRDDGIALVLERHFHELKQVRYIFDNENGAEVHP